MFRHHLQDLHLLFCSWTGDKAVRELQEAQISQQCFPILLECVTKVSLLHYLISYCSTFLIYQLIGLVEGNQSCYRSRVRHPSFEWPVSEYFGRFSSFLSFFCCHNYSLLIINLDFVFFFSRIILFADLFFLSKWESHR